VSFALTIVGLVLCIGIGELWRPLLSELVVQEGWSQWKAVSWATESHL